MIFWSQGLGQNSLNIPLHQANMIRDGEVIYITGKMGPPVFWDFKVTLREEDIKDIINVIQYPAIANFLISPKIEWPIASKIVSGALKFVFSNIRGLMKNSFQRESKRIKEE